MINGYRRADRIRISNGKLYPSAIAYTSIYSGPPGIEPTAEAL
jgi:hypothetical protein